MIVIIPPGPFVAPLATAETALIKMIARHPRDYLRGGESTMNPIGITHPRSAWKGSSQKFVCTKFLELRRR
jgi:hypothetical protein